MSASSAAKPWLRSLSKMSFARDMDRFLPVWVVSDDDTRLEGRVVFGAKTGVKLDLILIKTMT